MNTPSVVDEPLGDPQEPSEPVVVESSDDEAVVNLEEPEEDDEAELGPYLF